MDTGAFYGAGKVTHVSTLAEVNETIKKAKHVVNVVALPPEAKDSGSQESDVENVADSIKKIFELARELELKENLESDEELEMALSSTRKKGFPKWKKVHKTILIDDNSIF